MTDRKAPVHRNGLRRARDAALGGVSLLALMLAGAPGEARSLSSSAASIPLTTLAQQAATAAAQQAAAAVAQAQASMARAAAAMAAARKFQQDAAAAAQAASSSVPNGLTTGGLMPTGGTNSDPNAGINADPTKWQNAANPVQTSNGSGVQVDITQTQQKAILYWDTFNVGAKTTVNFNQSASNWIALNRVLDPSLAPSQILGQVKAPGSVYIINRNGIIFGAGSQVNVQSLVASSLDIGKLGTDLTTRDQYFLNTGIANVNAFSVYDPGGDATTALIPGDVTVQRGASITANIATDISQLGSPGFVYLFGANVANSGLITAPTGEVGMVAARAIDLVPNGYSVLPSNVLGQDSKGNNNKFRGTEFRIEQFAAGYNSNGTAKNGPSYLPNTGAVTHDGLIDASRGIVVMNGDTVTIGNQGVISVDTSIGRNAMVLLRAATSVSMNGVISSLPYDDGTTLASGSAANSGGSTVQSFTPAYIEMSAQSSVTVGSSGLVSAPSASVVLRAIGLNDTSGNSTTYQKDASGASPGLFSQGYVVGGQDATGANGNPGIATHSPGLQTVLLAPGATIDVAGLQNVELPASYNFISFQPRAEFADMPLQRNGALYGQTLWIDIRASGKRSDGTSWVGTPLADASGFVNAVGRGIDQLMTTGGTVSLATGLGATKSNVPSVQTAGSVINMAGGSLKFLPGMVPTTRLLGIDGRIYSMANADPNMIYVGIAGQFTVDHARWGVSETWSSGTQTFSPGYTQGQDAGTLNVTTVSPVLQGTVYFGSPAGERQIRAGQLASQGILNLTTPSSVQIGSSASANFTSQSQVTTTLSADTLSGYGLSALTITANDLVVSSGNTLNLAPGGSFSVTAGAIDIAGTVSAAGGSINLVTDIDLLTGGDAAKPPSPLFGGAFKPPTASAVITANVFVEGALDVSGRFVNDSGRFGTDAIGPGFINGGTISITTNKNSYSPKSGPFNGQWLDITGSILLAKTSVLDVSSGGYISPQGKPKAASTGTMAGKAGSISLVLYQSKWGATDSGVNIAPVGSPVRAVIEVDGSLRAYGFESNGSLRLGSADTIRVGGTLQPGETSAIRIGGVSTTLPVSLLTGGGFGGYTLESIADGWSTGYTTTANIAVSAGVNLTLQQQNLASTFDYSATATGTKLDQQSTPPLALLPDDQRSPVNLALKADTILLDTGAKIVSDPKAKITFGGSPDPAVSDATRDKPATNVTLRGSIIDHGGTVFINALQTQLGPKALVDLSGTFVANSRFGMLGGPATSGTYLQGGTFAVEAGALTLTNVGNYTTYLFPGEGAGYLVADAGATVDVSGSAGTVQVQGSRGVTSSVSAWSDAGTVSADVGAFAWGGSLVAIGGRFLGSDGQPHADPHANGGTLIVGGSNAISLRQDTTDVNSAVAAFDSGTNSPTVISLAADQLSQFDNVFLYSVVTGSSFNSVPSSGGAARIFNELPGNIYSVAAPQLGQLTIQGSLNWHVGNGLRIAAGTIASNTANSAVTLDAPYVLLTGGGTTPVAGSSTLTVDGQTIDVEGAALSGFGQVSLISSGDIRFSTPKVANGTGITVKTPLPNESSTFTGSLASAGNLLLSAQRIYPVSAVDFTITTPGNVKFAAPAGSSTSIPLSAGGGITVIANNIDQAGNLFAPLGTIKLGNSDSTVSPITTQTVTLESGSLTSVTLAGMLVPYGATADGTNWYYNANLNPLSQPPSKVITLSGASITGDFKTIDVRGGGDLQAMEWIQGKGGSRDTLTTTPSGQTVYALLPSQNDPVSAFDIHFTTARSPDAGKTIIPGDAYPLAGTQITIAGGNGIPAGTYTLEPAHYATLPGALRVVDYGSNLGHNMPSGTTLADGTVLVTGQYTQSTAPGKQSTGQSLFAVQTGAVWQQYSEYSFNRANSYFSLQAAKQGATAPRLPMDAGRLAVIAQQSILLSGVALTQPGQDSLGNTGRGSELDISAPQIAVVGRDQHVNNDIPAGYVGLDATQLGGFESILIGGLRTDTTTGTLITPTATNVVVDTRGDKLTAPEILLVSQATGQWQELHTTVSVGSDPANAINVLVDIPVYQPLAGTGTVTVKTGSIIETMGTVHAGFGRNYYFGSLNSGLTAAAQVAAALGGTLDSSGTLITGVDLAKLPAFWFPNGSQSSSVTNKGVDISSLAFYSYGGSQPPALGALFAASNDPTLALTGPTGTGVSLPALTIQFAAVTSGEISGVPASASGNVSGSVTLPAGDTSNSGRVSIEAGARISTNTLTLQATAATNAIVINTTDLHASQVNLTAPTIGIGASAPVAGKSLVLAANSAQFADVQGLTLKAMSGPVTVYGDFDPGQTMKSLTLDAAGIGLGAQALNPGTILSLRQGELLVFPLGTPGGAASVQFSVGVSVTSAAGVTTNYAANTPITLGANSKVSVAAAGTLTVSGSQAVTLLSDSLVTASDKITLTNSGSGTFASRSAGNGNTLGLVAKEIDLGGGNQIIAGYSAVNWFASDHVFIAGSGTMTLGAGTDNVDLTVTTPNILVASATATNSQSFALKTLGNVSVVDSVARSGVADRPTDSAEIGGSLSISAANITVASTIQAQAGTITLDAIAGNVTLNAGAYLAAGGYKKTLVDVDTYVAGGKVVLEADPALVATGAGNVSTDQSSVIDVAQVVDPARPAAGLQGYGGEIDVTALKGGATLAGALRGGGGPGLGGRFKLDIKGAAVLTALADNLLNGGINGAIDIHTGTGNLELLQGHTLKANVITLTADDTNWNGNDTTQQFGQIIIAGTLDASGYAGNTADGSGQAGGQVALWGANAVILKSTGMIDASTGNANERGGDVLIGIPWAALSWDPVAKTGGIDLQSDSVINVSGGTKGGGTVTLRAPLVDGSNDVKIQEIKSTIMNPRAVTIEGFVAISTDGTHGIDGRTLTASNGQSVIWDGIIDPAGYFDSNMKFVNGTWTNVTVGQLMLQTAGSGYTSVPTIVISGDGIGATATTSLTVVSASVTNGGSYTSRPTVTFSVPGRTGSVATGNAIMGLNTITAHAPTTLTDGAIVTISGGGGTGATGIASVQNGILTGVTIKSAGTGFTTAPTSLVIGVGQTGGQTVAVQTTLKVVTVVTVTPAGASTGGIGYTGVANISFSGGGQTATASANASMGLGPVALTSAGSGYSANPTISLVGGGGTGASLQFQDNLSSGTEASGTFALNATIPNSIVFGIFDHSFSGGATFTPTVANSAHILFSTDTLKQVAEGTWKYKDTNGNSHSYGFSSAISRLDLATLARSQGAGVVHVRPGIELLNPASAINGGNITVASNWNLAAGTAYNADTSARGTYVQPYDSSNLATSFLTFDYRYLANYGTATAPVYAFEAGALTLRAKNDIDINASLSDGFFQFRNYLDSTYNNGLISLIGTGITSRGTDPNLSHLSYYLNGYINNPVAPYKAAANTASPTAQDLAAADLFPNQISICSNCAGKTVYVQGASNTIARGTSFVVTADTTAIFGTSSSTVLSTYTISGVTKAITGGQPTTIPAGSTVTIGNNSQFGNSSQTVIFPNINRDGNNKNNNSYVLSSGQLTPANLVTVTNPTSWSYRLTAGADFDSANPNATVELTAAKQDVTVNNHKSYLQQNLDDFNHDHPQFLFPVVNLPTMVRTGTGNITIAAARDVELADTVAPGVIYAAGVNTQRLADPNYRTVNGVVQASNPDGFLEPQVLAYSAAAAFAGRLYYGPPTAAAFPQDAGDVEIVAQRDIIGYNGSGNKTVQYYQPWLLAQMQLTPATTGFGEGVFTPSGTDIASQTAWWIQYGSFQQGILSAGGNVSLIAGRNLIDVSVSLPTTGRVSGGLSATSKPMTHLYGSGNMVVRAGQNILGGSFYEGSGHASITARGSVGQNGTISRFSYDPTLRQDHPNQYSDFPLLAVDTGQIEMTAGGSITMAGVINPAELHAQKSTGSQNLYFDTYGPDSKVRLVAATGDLTITVAPTAISESPGTVTIPASASVYPASFEALALNGSLITTGISDSVQAKGETIPMPGIVLSPSLNGTFELLAQDKVDLTFGYPANTTLLGGTPHPLISAGPALIDMAFDPFQPNSGFDLAFVSPVLAHQNDAAAKIDTVARIYAATGDIVASGSNGNITTSDLSTADLRIEINRPTKVHAGRDIVDLNIIVQNIHPGDVSTIEAARNIFYTGFNNAGGIQVAGPGFLVVQAGGDVGPFLPAAHDFADQAAVQEGIASVGNASATPVGNVYISGGSVGIYDAALLGPSSNPRRNALLTTAAGTTQGADIAVMFGVKYGADYQAVINSYIDPANAANVDHNYIGELQAFLIKIGKPVSVADATTLSKADNNVIFDAFKALPADLQHVFIDQVFFAELKAVGVAQQQSGAAQAQYQPGFKMINTLFPSSLGYTANALGGGPNGANQLVKTGDLDLLHGTIQSRLGGHISLFGPGGNILVGSLAAEPNSKLKLSDIGLLSLGGGDINTFTDQSVLVNSSRVLTTQGGDITMWSSNGNLDAGRGSKTTLSQPALQAQYDSNDYQSIDLGGFVTGAGIGTVQASKVAKKSNLYLLAPRGIIDAGTAGVRASGNAVFSAVVINNASNIQVQGTTTGVPVVAVPNIGALTSGSNTAGAAAKSADAPTAAGGNRDRASLFMVEVVGYGGGDGQSKPAADSVDGQNQPAAGGAAQPDTEPSDNKRKGRP